jgi:DNA-binding CsgD family transcriptional regulator
VRSRTELSPLQLNIVMHIANGMAFQDIADTCVCSISYVKQQAAHARRKTNTRTLPQLVSVVIARGQLAWEADHRVLAQPVPPQEAQANTLVDGGAHDGARVA